MTENQKKFQMIIEGGKMLLSADDHPRLLNNILE